MDIVFREESKLWPGIYLGKGKLAVDLEKEVGAMHAAELEKV